MENETASGAVLQEGAQQEAFGGMHEHFKKAEASHKEDVKQEAAPSPAKEVTPTAPSSKDVKPAEGELAEPDWNKLPAHMHPTVKGIMEERKRDREKLRQAEAMLKDPRVARMLAKGEPQEAPKQVQTSASKESNLPEEQKAAAEQLIKILGLDGIQQQVAKLQERNAELTNRETEAAFDKEEEQLKTQASEYGLDWESEVMPQVAEWFEKNPSFRGLGPGSIKIAFESTFFGKMGELQGRAANLKLIKAQQEKSKVGTESPQKVSSKATVKDESIGAFFKRRATEMGD